METRRTVLKYLTGAMGASACGLDALESFAQQLNGQARGRTSCALWAKGCAGMSFRRRATSCCTRRTWIASAAKDARSAMRSW